MKSSQAQVIGNDLLQVTNLLQLEGSYTFSTQSKIQQATGCAFRDAQIATKKVLDKFIPSATSVTYPLDDKLIKEDLANLIIIEVAHLKKVMSKNFDLSEHEFLQLINRLKQGDNSLFEKVFLEHFESCLQFVKKKFSISYDEAYDITMDTLLVFRKKLVTDKVKYGNIRFLFTQMACQHHIKKSERTGREKANAESFDYDSDPIDEASIAVLRESWPQLGNTCQDLLKKIFYGNMRLTAIAAEEQNLMFPYGNRSNDA